MFFLFHLLIGYSLKILNRHPPQKKNKIKIKALGFILAMQVAVLSASILPACTT